MVLEVKRGLLVDDHARVTTEVQLTSQPFLTGLFSRVLSTSAFHLLAKRPQSIPQITRWPLLLSYSFLSFEGRKCKTSWSNSSVSAAVSTAVTGRSPGGRPCILAKQLHIIQTTNNRLQQSCSIETLGSFVHHRKCHVYRTLDVSPLRGPHLSVGNSRPSPSSSSIDTLGLLASPCRSFREPRAERSTP